jgi:5-formyltetrahydrofolate cyclo-ligase
MKKNKLRKIYLSKQKSLSSPERHERSLHINSKLFENFDFDAVRYLHLFLSIREKNEVDTSVIINDLWSDYINIKTIVPRVDFEKDVLEHLEFNSESKLKLSDWGIPEPVGDKLIDERKIDLVLVPLLVFDKRGYRVGYGKGFYDKFLSKCCPDCRKVGLSFFEPIEEIEDIHEFDVKLDFCITPERIYSFNKL